MRITIKDISRLSGFSTATVSRVINNHPSVREKTRAKIKKIIKNYSYRPSIIARSLTTRRTGMIGLILSHITNPFYTEIAETIADEARKYNYSVIFCNTNDSTKIQREYINLLYEKRVDGMIFASVHLYDPDVIKLMMEGMHVVLVNRRLEGPRVDSVTVDNVKGAYLVVEHLIEHGHEKIGIIRGVSEYSTDVDRFEGYQRALQNYRLDMKDTFIKWGNFERKGGYSALKGMLKMKDRPTAIFAASDDMALGAWEMILESGLKIPDDIALVGFDDIDLASFKGIELTTISQRKREMGIKAVRLLMNRIMNKGKKAARQIALEPKLVIRKSCGCTINRGITRI